MAEFSLRGVRLCLPDAVLGGNLSEALETGRYEHTEAEALVRHLQPGDRVLDLGAGAGDLCCLAARIVGSAAVTGVEALPDMAEAARNNLSRNGFTGVTIIDGAIVGPTHHDQTVRFGERAAFWASALAPASDATPKGLRVREVPALKLSDLLDRLSPTVLICDIEGAEREALDIPLPLSLRMIVIEVHPNTYGIDGTRTVFDMLFRQGFGFQPYGSHAATVVFERIDPTV